MCREWDFPVGIKPIESIELKNENVVSGPEGKRVIYNKKTGEGLNIVSDRYMLLPHRLVRDTVLEKLREVKKGPISSVWTLSADFGKIVAFHFPLVKTDMKPKTKGGDLVELGIRVVNSYDGKRSLTIEAAGRRLVCSNGMTKPTHKSLPKPHRGEFDEKRFANNVEKMVLKVLIEVGSMEETIKKSVEKHYSGERLRDIFRRVSVPYTYKRHASDELLESLPEEDLEALIEKEEDGGGDGKVEKEKTENSSEVRGEKKEGTVGKEKGREGKEEEEEEKNGLPFIPTISPDRLKKVEFTAWKVYNAFTSAITHTYQGKSVDTQRKHEKEAYRILTG